MGFHPKVNIKDLCHFCLGRSPMFAHLSATLEGLTTIRSSNSVEKVTEEFFDCQDHQSEAWYLVISASRWFSIRLEALLVVFISFSIFAPFIINEFSSKCLFHIISNVYVF